MTFAGLLEASKFVSANYGVSSNPTRKERDLRECYGCNEKVRVDAVQGWSVGCLRSDVLS